MKEKPFNKLVISDQSVESSKISKLKLIIVVLIFRRITRHCSQSTTYLYSKYHTSSLSKDIFMNGNFISNSSIASMSNLRSSSINSFSVLVPGNCGGCCPCSSVLNTLPTCRCMRSHFALAYGFLLVVGTSVESTTL